jgi:uncharacterized protein
MHLTLCLTHDCDMACAYCYAGRKVPRAMTRKTVEEAIRFAARLEPGPFQLGFFGGEPLLEWELLRFAVGEALGQPGDREIVFTLTTNGTGLTEERAAWLGRHDFYLGVSIDGHRAMHETCRKLRGGASSFDLVAEGLRHALVRPDRMETIMVLDPRNVRHVAEGIEFLAGLGVRRISLNPNFHAEWDAAALAALEAAYEAAGDFLIAAYRNARPVAINVIDAKIITRLKDGYAPSDRCKFGCGEIAVAPSGRIYPCERLVGNDDDDAVCLGTVRAGIDVAKRLALAARRGNRDPECAECSLRRRCMNWCGCINYATTGAIDSAPALVCFHEKLSIRVADRVAETLFKEGNPDFLTRFYGEDLV